jgi:hypothetical protein
MKWQKAVIFLKSIHIYKIVPEMLNYFQSGFLTLEIEINQYRVFGGRHGW